MSPLSLLCSVLAYELVPLNPIWKMNQNEDPTCFYQLILNSAFNLFNSSMFMFVQVSRLACIYYVVIVIVPLALLFTLMAALTCAFAHKNKPKVDVVDVNESKFKLCLCFHLSLFKNVKDA